MFPENEATVGDDYPALIAAAREKAEWRWPMPINYLEGDAEHAMIVALRHAYVLGVGDAASLIKERRNDA